MVNLEQRCAPTEREAERVDEHRPETMADSHDVRITRARIAERRRLRDHLRQGGAFGLAERSRPAERADLRKPRFDALLTRRRLVGAQPTRFHGLGNVAFKLTSLIVIGPGRMP